MNYYQFHIGDFRSGTVNMSRNARWIYRDMLDIYYDTESPLPSDIETLLDMLGVDSDAERLIVERHLKFKFELSEDGYRHAVCDKVVSEYRLKADVARENGKRGGRPKSSKIKPNGLGSGSVSVANGNQENSGLQTNQEPLTTNQEPETNNQQSAENPAADKRRNWVRELVKLGVTENHAKDWLEVRKAKKAKMTDTALEGVQREAEIAGITLGEAVKIAAERSWQGFKASWLRSDQTKNPGITKHTGFSDRDYHEGLIEREDGSYGF